MKTRATPPVADRRHTRYISSCPEAVYLALADAINEIDPKRLWCSGKADMSGGLVPRDTVSKYWFAASTYTAFFFAKARLKCVDESVLR